MPYADGTLSLAEYAALPQCPKCGHKLAFHSDAQGNCTRCAAVALPTIVKQTEHIFGLLTERLMPHPLCELG